jgi:hypothetical protein
VSCCKRCFSLLISLNASNDGAERYEDSSRVLPLVGVWPTIPGEHLVSSGEEDEHYVPKRNDFFEKVPRV